RSVPGFPPEVFPEGHIKEHRCLSRPETGRAAARVREVWRNGLSAGTERQEEQGWTSRSSFDAVGRDGALSCAYHTGTFGPRHPLQSRLSRVERSQGISLAGTCAPPCPCGDGAGNLDVRRASLAGATLGFSGPTASAGRRAIHAAVLPAHDGIAR